MRWLSPRPRRRAAIGGGALRRERRRRLVRRARGDPGLRIEKRRGRSAARHEFPWRFGHGFDAGEAPSLCRSRPPAWRLETLVTRAVLRRRRGHLPPADWLAGAA